MHEPRINYVWPMHKFLTGMVEVNIIFEINLVLDETQNAEIR